MRQIIEYIRVCSKVLLQKMGMQVVEPPRNETQRQSEKPLRTERRRETRSPRISPCTYGLTRSVDQEGTILEEGYGTAVNDSSSGLRLLLSIAPSKGQILEVQTSHSTHGRTIRLLEVCWTKPLHDGPEETLYLVGCRRSFDRTHDKAV